MLGKLEPMRTDRPQGDLIAWAPNENKLAYVAPTSNSNWYSGRLKIASGPTYTDIDVLTPETLIFGDLLWSPDGSQIAFVAMRLPELFTVMLIPSSEGRAVDLFPDQSAVTDSWGSSKAILEWSGSTLLRVLSSCGEDCDKLYEINTTSLTANPINGDQRKDKLKRLALHLNQQPDESITYPVMINANWSPDGKKIAYLDKYGNTWIILLDRKSQYMIEVKYGYAREAKWANDSTQLAMRTDDEILIYNTACK